jgi:hypothetical protein
MQDNRITRASNLDLATEYGRAQLQIIKLEVAIEQVETFKKMNENLEQIITQLENLVTTISFQ